MAKNMITSIRLWENVYNMKMAIPAAVMHHVLPDGVRQILDHAQTMQKRPNAVRPNLSWEIPAIPMRIAANSDMPAALRAKNA
jgi:hypothetical protein